MYLEVVGEHGSTLTPLPKGGSYGHQVSRRTPCPHWLYVLEAVPDGLIKVGSTHQLAARVKTHRAELRERHADMALACRALWPLGCVTRGDAARHEYAVHGDLRRRFGLPDNRRSPEWYDAPLADVIALAESYINHLDDSTLMGLA